MKKLLILITFFTLSLNATSFANDEQEEKFVNPIFYNDLLTISFPDGAIVKLTPNQYSMDPADPKMPTIIEPCKLLENAEEQITLECQRKYSDETEPVEYTFYITHIDESEYPDHPDYPDLSQKTFITQSIHPGGVREYFEVLKTPEEQQSAAEYRKNLYPHYTDTSKK